MVRHQELLDALKGFFYGKGKEFVVNQDVNASSYDSGEVSVGGSESLDYEYSGGGAFDLVITQTDGSGTTIKSNTVSSTDGSAVSGSETLYTRNVQVQVNDTSAAANTVTGSGKTR